jgi:hypothetical protein
MLHNKSMSIFKCPLCGGKMKRHGKTKSGSQRWQCMSCCATETHKIGSKAKSLQTFLDWLLSRKLQAKMPGGGRTFRRNSTKLWNIWPMPPLVEERNRVVYVDGLHLGRKAVILIARGDEYVLGWYLARTEHSGAWEALMRTIAPPDVVVSDGGSGFDKARRRAWPNTHVQRCTFHAFCQVKRYTTSRPKLLAGMQLYLLAKELLSIKEIEQAAKWLSRYAAWCSYWSNFLAEKTWSEGRYVLTHARLVKAKQGLDVLIKKGTLFTYLNPELAAQGLLPSTNNKIEGGVNAPLRQILRDHRGMSLVRRIKAVFWWCYMHTERPLPPAELLRTMPTDEDIANYYYKLSEQQQLCNSVPNWGDAIVWSELHNSTPFRSDWD